METRQTYLLIVVFVLGILAGVIYSNLTQNLSGFAVLDSKGLQTISSPSDYITEDALLLYQDKLTIKVNNASITNYADTQSMLPFLTNSSNGILVVPLSEKDIAVGDIVSFASNNLTLAHRIIEINTDEYGTYFITQGDNSNIKDEKIRFSDIKYKLIGILY